MAGLADTLAKRKANKPTLKTKSSKVNGVEPKGLAATLAKKKQGKLGGKGLAGLKAKKDAEKAASSKQDFWHKALRYHNAKVIEIIDGRPVGRVDVSNNDATITFHNRYVAWFHDVAGGGGIMKEPRSVEITTCLHQRFERELRALEIPNQAQARKKREEEEAAAKKRKGKKTKQKSKPTLKTKKERA